MQRRVTKKQFIRAAGFNFHYRRGNLPGHHLHSIGDTRQQAFFMLFHNFPRFSPVMLNRLLMAPANILLALVFGRGQTAIRPIKPLFLKLLKNKSTQCFLARHKRLSFHYQFFCGL